MPITNWPGQQINDINEFRTACYKTCHEANPTDSGWYEKENECGRECASKLCAFQKQSGKNPCAQRLQAPVFWFTNEKDLKENYESFDQNQTNTSRLDILYVILLSFFLLFLLIAIILHLLKK